MRNRPSIKDIAELANVAPSTVSRALAGSTRVSAATRQRIQAIAEELSYTPSAAARSLVTGASYTLGIVAPSLADPYIAAVMKGIEEASTRADYQHVVATTAGDPRQEIEVVRMLLGHNLDGLIVLSSRAGSAYEDILPNLAMPVAFVNSVHRGKQVFSISNDNEHGGWMATNHLIGLGHKRIAYLGGPGNGRSQLARAAGYRRALQEADIPFDRTLILTGDGAIAAGRAALETLLAHPSEHRPTAIFCYNDLSALGLLASAHEHGVRIPEDLAVVGFDNAPYAEISAPPLTTIDQRTAEMGRLAVENILAALREEPIADIQLRGELIIRRSTTEA